MNKQFKLSDLMWFTAVIAVGAWLYSFSNSIDLVWVWATTVFGIQIGLRTDYPTIPMGLCGTLMGIALALSLRCTGFVQGSMIFAFNGVSLAWFVLALFPGVFGVVLGVWLITRLQSKTAA